ncbi:MAG: hypothetical protein JWN92_127 [Candidatus Acidoferrum typicum]|jgi:glycosyltransferase involved in cell wall biosynthesis|nr:hypothetical protein [Candidatus Acidoferrum typicum]
MTRSNTVSAVILTHGRPDFLIRAVRGALAQTYKDLEVIVVIDRMARNAAKVTQ